MHTLRQLFLRIKKLHWGYQVGGIVVLVGLAALLAHTLTSRPGTADVASDVTHVRIASVASLSNQSGPLPVTGQVTSVSKASILAVSSGEIISLNRSLGERVSAGSVIASFENSSQRAALLQAQGAYDGAKAALAKASGSTAQNSDLSSAQAAQSAQNAEVAAGSALRSAYASLDDAVHTKADALFSNAHGSVPQLNLAVPDSQLVVNIQNQRVSLDTLLESVRLLGLGDSGGTVGVDARASASIAKAQTVAAFLDDLVQALNAAVPTQNMSASVILTYQTSVGAARSEVLAAISSLTSAKSAYDSATSGAAVAQNSASSGTTNDVAGAEANLKSALGALNAAQANLEKTVIRAPISGTIVSLPITRGGYVAAFSQVAQISNPGALEVQTYVTSDDAKTLAVGGKATIEGATPGVIVFIAPALDPTTGKIQVKVGIPGDQKMLTDGNTVSLSLERATGGAAASGGASSSLKAASAITIPIIAAKITPAGPVVFTVSSSTLVAKPITLGAIVGSQVHVTNGLSAQMDIVTDARGLSDGQRVMIDPI